jgi:hypothetical protein
MINGFAAHMQLLQEIYSAVHYSDRSKRQSGKKACEDVGVASSNYYRWLNLLKENPEWVTKRQVPSDNGENRRNGMALSEDLRQRIVMMARSVRYESPRQIAKALEIQRVAVSGNTLRNNLESASLNGFGIVMGSKGKAIKKKEIIR